MGAGHGARVESRAALRLVGIRRNSRLQDADRCGGLPPDGSRAAPVQLGEDLPHQDSVLARHAGHRMPRRRPRERTARRRVHQADRLSRLRRDGCRGQHRTTGERLGGGLGMGLVLGRRRPRARRRCLCLVVAARRAEHGPCPRQGRRQLSVERARDARGAPARIHGGPRLEHRGVRQRRRRRELYS